MLVSLIALAISTAGYFAGAGVYGFLRTNPVGYGGLYQAYLLMFIIALTLWLGASQTNALPWHMIGLLAHVPPLTIVLLLWSELTAVSGAMVGVASLTFHTIWIVVEALAALSLMAAPVAARSQNAFR
jgi:hypothetical protein